MSKSIENFQGEKYVLSKKLIQLICEFEAEWGCSLNVRLNKIETHSNGQPPRETTVSINVEAKF